MKPSNTIVVSTKYIEEKEHQIADLSKKVERLQEQLADANEVINDDLHEANSCFAVGRIRKYKEKWGVK